jgi:hypothetical protein
MSRLPPPCPGCLHHVQVRILWPPPCQGCLHYVQVRILGFHHGQDVSTILKWKYYGL